MELKEIISRSLSNIPLYQSYLGKRTDDIGHNKLVQSSKAKCCRLNHAEKRQIKELWGKIIPFPLSIGYSFYEMVKAVTDFQANYLPSAYYMPYIFNVLNDKSGLKVLGHKGLQSVLFRGCKQPETIVSKISGIFYDANYNQISHQEALSILDSYGTDMIYKPATDSSMGRGICLIKYGTKLGGWDNLLMQVNDFIIQEKVIQSSFMANLNESSLNCMRFTSININGKVSIENRIVKIGAKGSVVDNIGAGSGGMMIGLTDDGTLCDVGFRVDGTKVTSNSDIPFGGLQIPNFKDTAKTVINLHSKIESMKIIGWDIALDRNNQPILIEANIYWPGITIEQIAGGPVFGERTNELIDFVHKKRK